MTYKELRDFLNTLIDEQLAQTAIVVGVETPGGRIAQAEILDEDWVDDEEAPCPRSIYEENKEPDWEQDPPIIWRKGEVHIVFETTPQGANMTESNRAEEGIATEKKYRYITIRLGNERFEGRPVYRIFNNKSGGQLAVLSWYKPWRTYVFSSHDGCVFNHSCLKDVIGFLEGITR